MKVNIERETKGFVWYSLRIAFYSMVILFLVLLAVDILVLNLLFLILMLFCIVVSIIHLVKHQKKAFAIVALVISSLVLLLYIIGLSVMNSS